MQIKGRLSERAARAWDRMVTREGVTTSAVLEAIGQALADGWQPPRKIIDQARKIDRDRRSRH